MVRGFWGFEHSVVLEVEFTWCVLMLCGAILKLQIISFVEVAEERSIGFIKFLDRLIIVCSDA